MIEKIEYDIDLFVIGAGSGGVSCARRAASYGAKVVICEEYRVGGTCVIRGCVPKKLLMYAGKFREAFRDAINFGWDEIGTPKHDWSRMIKNVQDEVTRLNGIYKNMLDGSNVEMLEGHGEIIGPHQVKVGQKTYRAKHILIATGGAPWTPAFEGSELCDTSNEIFEYQALPQNIVIIGGGYIAVEFASILNNLGANITQVIRSDHILNGFDHETRCKLQAHMGEKGIKLIPNVNPKKLVKTDVGYTLTLDSGEVLKADHVISATGRRPNIDGLGLDIVGVKTGKVGEIFVDDFSQTNVPGIYAVGDVTNIAPLTPVAIKYGRALAETLFNDTPTKVDLYSLPTAVFSDPAMANVGLTEEQARETGKELDIYRSEFRHMKYTIPKITQKTFMKLIVDKTSQIVLGAQMIGDDAPEIMQLLGVAITCRATKADFDKTIALHPSAAEEFVLMT